MNLPGPLHLTELKKQFKQHQAVRVYTPGLSAAAYLARSCVEKFSAPWVWLLDTAVGMERFASDLLSLQGLDEPDFLLFPPWEVLPTHEKMPHPRITGQRLHTLSVLRQHPHRFTLITSIQALMQKTLSATSLSQHSIELELTDEQDPQDIANRLADWGYEFSHEVAERGEASLRGGLLDVWPLAAEHPVRIEFFGDVIDSIRTFDPLEQTSLQKIHRIQLTPAQEEDAQAVSLFDYLPEQVNWGLFNPADIADRGSHFDAEIREQTEEGASFLSVEAVLQHLQQQENLLFCGELPSTLPGIDEVADLDLQLAGGERMPNLEASVFHPDMMEQNRRMFLQSLAATARAGAKLHLFFDTDGTRERFIQQYQEETQGNAFIYHTAPLSDGFVNQRDNVLVITENDLYGYERTRRQRPLSRKKAPSASLQTAQLATWTELVPGELVVHADHGLGKYLGLYEIKFNDQLQEVLAIEYANKAKLYVPATLTHLLSRYVGVGKYHPELHHLGGKRWERQKAAAEKSIEDMAAVLLETQGAREALQGHAFAADTIWQHELERSFPYEETDDQLRAIQDVKQDMERPRPMDRLICGDVGYGKTEVAMRAAFKAVMDGKQVAVLVPTTVLAQQHFFTFTDRMSAFPVTVEMLSRFRTKGEQNAIIKRLKNGEVDIVIGTHRLTSKDIAFKDLGLVIIDEEQRFGVAHKERLKQMRQLVDVLTLTATPIPRTLYMSLTGARDMSTIQTPPQERLAISTIVTDDDDNTIRKAIMHEINRDGQVFFLHNRVQTIHKVHARLQSIVPEAWISVAHGQMTENKLAKVMRKFTEGRFNVLLCTTIIESGVDIPNCNTIIIDRADRFGLAELYQLRGRVGRERQQAYAYLLLPRHKRLFDAARKRISTIRRYSSLGAGFKVALRDLEIRGAGNLLGSQQSGHISAIGFDLYCQLLRRTVAAKQGKPLPPAIHVEMKFDFLELSPRNRNSSNAAAIPYDYIEEENQRVNTYRSLAAAATPQEVNQLRDQLIDRFGRMPEPAKRLLLLTRIRIEAGKRGIQHIEVKNNKVMLQCNNQYIQQNHRFPQLTKTTATPRLNELLRMITALNTDSQTP